MKPQNVPLFSTGTNQPTSPRSVIGDPKGSGTPPPHTEKEEEEEEGGKEEVGALHWGITWVGYQGTRSWGGRRAGMALQAKVGWPGLAAEPHTGMLVQLPVGGSVWGTGPAQSQWGQAWLG